MKNIYLASLIILIAVGLNMGLIGLLNIDIIGIIIKGGTLTKVWYIIVGVAATLVAFNKIKMKG